MAQRMTTEEYRSFLTSGTRTAKVATVGADGTGGGCSRTAGAGGSGAEIGGDCCEPAELGRAAVSGCDAVALG